MSVYDEVKTTIYSNPRMEAVIDNWPSGGKRVTARFAIETHPKRGQRGIRMTTGKPKALTYGRAARIVDGDDGKTYVAVLAHDYDMVTIMQGDFKYHAEYASPSNPRYPALRALFGA